MPIPLLDYPLAAPNHRVKELDVANDERPWVYTTENLLDPTHFFRINRQILLHDQAIQEVVTISNSRLKISIPFAKDAVVVSRERCQEFKEWLDR